MKWMIAVGAVASAVVVLVFTASCSSIGRKLLYYPTHRAVPPGGVLTPWNRNGELIGYARVVASPKNVWLLLHGNGGQASDRSYALPSFSPEDSVYILEYPGYGNRAGISSQATFNRAAQEAYLTLRDLAPQRPVCVVSESIGSGPASFLASLSHPPDKLVLIVPFDRLTLVARDHFPAIIVTLLLKDKWDNLEALKNYKGTVEIFGAVDDTVIPVGHAQALAAGVPSSKFTLIEGGHNDWAAAGRVMIRNP